MLLLLVSLRLQCSPLHLLGRLLLLLAILLLVLLLL